MSTTAKTRTVAALLALAAMVLGASRTNAAQDVPARGVQTPEEIELRVARISFVEGTVLTLRGEDDDWVDADVNMALLPGDQVHAGPDGRVEVELQQDVVARLDRDSFLQIAELTDRVTALDVPSGRAAVHARPVDYSRAEVRIRMPAFEVSVVDHANLRLEAVANGTSWAMVRRGQAQIQTSTGHAQMAVRGQAVEGTSGSNATLHVIDQRVTDGFDGWNDRRDALTVRSQSRTYLARGVSGYSELDQYGGWVEIEDYGRVWRPTVVSTDWAPYRVGDWVWRDVCGWTWVSNEPWGWLPYHYGRWVYHSRHRWCWVPVGVRTAIQHPAWSPAWVTFSYADHGWSFGLSIGIGYSPSPHVGWFPLGPRDPYPHRSWRSFGSHHSASPQNGHHSGLSASSGKGTHTYQNQHVRHAVTVTKADHLGKRGDKRRSHVTLFPQRDAQIRTGQEAVSRLPEQAHSRERHQLFPSPEQRAQSMERARAHTAQQTTRGSLIRHRSESASHLDLSTTRKSRNKASSSGDARNNGVSVPQSAVSLPRLQHRSATRSSSPRQHASPSVPAPLPESSTVPTPAPRVEHHDSRARGTSEDSARSGRRTLPSVTFAPSALSSPSAQASSRSSSTQRSDDRSPRVPVYNTPVQESSTSTNTATPPLSESTTRSRSSETGKRYKRSHRR